jgi:hypothetical protein
MVSVWVVSWCHESGVMVTMSGGVLVWWCHQETMSGMTPQDTGSWCHGGEKLRAMFSDQLMRPGVMGHVTES